MMCLSENEDARSLHAGLNERTKGGTHLCCRSLNIQQIASKYVNCSTRADGNNLKANYC